MSGQLPDDKDELMKSHLIISPSTMDMKSKYDLILSTRGSVQVQVRLRHPALVPDVGGFRHTEGIIQIHHDILRTEYHHLQHIEMLLGVEAEGVGAFRRPRKPGTVRLTNTAPVLIVIVLQASSSA